MIEALEERRLMSGFTGGFAGLIAGCRGSLGSTSFSGGTQATTVTTAPTSNTSNSGSSSSSSAPIVAAINACLPFTLFGQAILFSQAPQVVQDGLTTLAITDGLTPPTATQTVFLGNSRGVETYTVIISGTGTVSRLTVDVNGNPVTAPTKTTTDWATYSAANPTGAAQILAIATALNLNAPTDTTTVQVVTDNGNTTYSVALRSATGSRYYSRTTLITVDSAGNPVGDDLKVPLNVLPSAIQNGLIANAPAGVTLDPTSTQSVFIDTFDGVPTYTMVFNSTGTRTLVTVDFNGNLVNLPSHSTDTFQTIPAATQTELQTLATADNVTTPIDPTQNIFISSQTNGVTVYTISLRDSSGHRVTISADQLDNPTVPAFNDDGWGWRFGIRR